jgi:hypothetical protein
MSDHVPLASAAPPRDDDPPPGGAVQEFGALPWSEEAAAALDTVPEVMREMTRRRLEMHARDLGRPAVTDEVVGDLLGIVARGSARVTREMTWSQEAIARVERIPEVVRGMVVKMIESDARRRGITEVTGALVGEAAQRWSETLRFHPAG